MIIQKIASALDLPCTFFLSFFSWKSKKGVHHVQVAMHNFVFFFINYGVGPYTHIYEKVKSFQLSPKFNLNSK